MSPSKTFNTAQSDGSSPIVAAGIDAVTLTMGSSVKGAEKWYRQGLGIARELEGFGNFYTKWACLGYIGVKSGPFFTGEREDGFIAKVTGGHSSWICEELYSPDAHCSRLDLQVTVRVGSDLREWGESIRRRADEHAKGMGVIGRRQIHVHEGADSGYTVYIGQRSSAEMGRAYDKEAEGGKEDWAECWRYEVELKKQMGNEALHRLFNSDVTNYAASRDFVCAWYKKNGVDVPWSSQSTFDVARPTPRLKSDVERVLAWLESDVQPSVRRLLPLVGRGTLMAALFGDGSSPPPEAGAIWVEED